MKKFLFVVVFSITTILSFGNHTKGGWMYYEYMGPGNFPNTNKYRITLKLYTACVLNQGQFDPTINFTVFDAGTLQQLYNIPVTNSNIVDIRNCNTQQCYPCINLIPSICYKIITYSIVQDLDKRPGGYTFSYQRCCRIQGIVNIIGSSSVGETWTVTIPGSAAGSAQFNTSARFAQNDTAIICQGSAFTFDFSATDINNDSLVYDFTPAFIGGGMGNPTPDPASPPPYTPVPYAGGYSGFSPMGGAVTINRTTGIVSGIGPGSGIYVLTVTVSEFNRTTRLKIAEVRKSLHIEVANCTLTQAVLNPKPTTCDGFTVNFQNDGSDANVTTWYWEFGDPASGANNTSTLPAPSHTYSDTGVYIVKFAVNRGQQCSDSTTLQVKVYPGFFPDFEVIGQCKNTAIQFNDLTTATYGVVNNWSWNFGDFGPNSTSSLQHPTHVYTTASDYTVRFIVGSSKGCIDTVEKVVTILDRPALSVTNDTLICVVDTLQLHAVGTGTFLWSPNYMISNVNSPDPFVSPDVTTTYTVQITDPFGCVGDDTVRVNVVNFVTQSDPADTTICQTDPIILNLISDALYFTWTPNDGSILDPTVRTPTVRPLTTTTYHVVGSISNKCFAEDDIVVRVVPYPDANAGPDQAVCLGASGQLNASGGSIYSWTPSAFLSATNIPNPFVVNPTSSVRYIVTVRDTLGCPKPVKDTVLFSVIRINANAGPPDTSVVLGQPLQLAASGGTSFLWTPGTWLSNPNIFNPVALPEDNILYKVRVSDVNGCVGFDSIFVRLYRVEAGLYIPNAFTPNGDGLNDVFRPIELGLRTLDLFRIYNRWGQMVFASSDIAKGWDGTFGGKGQDPGTFVWYAEGTDYTGKKVRKKGTVILIRE